MALIVGNAPAAAERLRSHKWSTRSCDSDDVGAAMASLAVSLVVAPPSLWPGIEAADPLPPIIGLEDEATLGERAAIWHPGDRTAPAFRLIDLFGAPALLPSYLGLAAQLRGQLAAEAPAEHAHRIAGLAGTLGFTALGEAWRAVSEGELAELPVAQRESRIVALAIEAAFGPRAPDRTATTS